MTAAWERDPDEGRPTMDATEAAHRKGYKTYRTVISQIKNGKIDGGKYSGKQRWWVYADDPTPVTELGEPTPAATQAPAAAEADLRKEMAEVRGRLRITEERYQVLLAAQGALNEAADSYRDSTAKILTTIEEFRAFTDTILEAATGFQRSADKWRQVAGYYRDVLAEMAIPDNLGEFYSAD